MSSYSIQGRIKSKRNGLPVPFADIEVLRVGTGVVEVVACGQSEIDGNFEICFDFLLPGRPSVIFRVSQNVDGMVRYIYNENPTEDVRLNIGDVLFVNIDVEEDCFVINPPGSGAPYDQTFVFTRVGVIPTANIDQASGYANVDTDPAETPEAQNSMDANAPFGRTLDIAGWFGMFCDVEYYKVQHSSDGITWQDIYDPLYNYWYDAPAGQWISEAMGPTTVDGVANLYRPLTLHPVWTFPDLIARWDTTKVQNGPYTLRILGKKMQSGSLVDATHLIPDPSYGTLKLLVDNSLPRCEIKVDQITHDGSPIGECSIVPFTGTLTVVFEAFDDMGHLRNYSLNAHYGHNRIVVPTPITPDKAVDDYSEHIGLSKTWMGGTYTIQYPASAYSSAEMPTCAYQLRLRVDKRTTNGYGLVYWGYEDNVHLTIQRP